MRKNCAQRLLSLSVSGKPANVSQSLPLLLSSWNFQKTPTLLYFIQSLYKERSFCDKLLSTHPRCAEGPWSWGLYPSRGGREAPEVPMASRVVHYFLNTLPYIPLIFFHPLPWWLCFGAGFSPADFPHGSCFPTDRIGREGKRRCPQFFGGGGGSVHSACGCRGGRMLKSWFGPGQLLQSMLSWG